MHQVNSIHHDNKHLHEVQHLNQQSKKKDNFNYLNKYLIKQTLSNNSTVNTPVNA